MSNDFIQSPFNKQRKDKYIIVIPYPQGLRTIVSTNHDNNTIIPKTLTMSVYGAIAPEVAVPASELRYAGQTMNVSSHVRTPYTAQTVEFTIDNRFNNYWFIYSWLNFLNNDKTSLFDNTDITGLEQSPRITDPKIIEQYSTDISIFALDEYEKRVIEFKYTRAFPTKLGGINFNHRDGEEATCSVDFAYSQFTASLVEQIETL